MKKAVPVSTLAVLLLLTLLSFASLRAADPKGQMASPQSVTVKGEVLDMACYTAKGAMGAKHRECALACLKMGQPMGLRTSDGKVYLLVADHQNSKPFDEAKGYAADQVEVTGSVAERDGLSALTVESIKKL